MDEEFFFLMALGVEAPPITGFRLEFRYLRGFAVDMGPLGSPAALLPFGAFDGGGGFDAGPFDGVLAFNGSVPFNSGYGFDGAYPAGPVHDFSLAFTYIRNFGVAL